MEIDQNRIENAIVAEVAERLIDEERLRNLVREATEQRINKLFKEHADATINGVIQKAINDGFEHEYQKVDTWGNPQGSKTTIRAELEKVISGYWSEKVDSHGKPSSSSYGERLTRAEWHMAQMVASDFKGEMKQHVVNIGGSLKDHLRKQLQTTVNELLSEVFRVRTEDDKKPVGI